MWKFFFYLRAQYDRVECYLSDMEAKGYRLEKMAWRWFFKFKRAEPKKTKYLFLYDYLGDARGHGGAPGMDLRFGQRIRSEYAGIEIPCRCGVWLSDTLYRICKAEVDLSEIKAARVGYLKRSFFKKLCTTLIFGAFSALPWLIPPHTGAMLMLPFAVGSTLYLLYQIIEWIFLLCQCKKG